MTQGFELFLTAHIQWKKRSKPINDEIVAGWVTTPPPAGTKGWFNKHSGRGDGRPVIIDNGAWGRFLRGEHKDPLEVFAAQVEYAERVGEDGHEIRMLLLPDVVGDWTTTMENAWRCPVADHQISYGLVLQDGWQPSDVREFTASNPGTRLFVGGSDFNFKRRCVDEVQRSGVVDEIHVGRVSSLHHMLWASRHPLVRSVDNSTFTREGMRTKYGGDVAGTLYRRIMKVRSQQTLRG